MILLEPFFAFGKARSELAILYGKRADYPDAQAQVLQSQERGVGSPPQ
jgi:hypothetical protein